MADKKIYEFAVPTDAQTADSTQLWVFGDPVTGLLYKPTGAQVKRAMSTYKYPYTANGTEASTLTISAIANKEILMISREGQVMWEVEADPDEVEFIFDGTTITLGLAVTMPGERFLILYKTPE
jgi:hypothetical protein